MRYLNTGPDYQLTYVMGPFSSDLGIENVVIASSPQHKVEVLLREAFQTAAENQRYQRYMENADHAAAFIPAAIMPFENTWLDPVTAKTSGHLCLSLGKAPLTAYPLQFSEGKETRKGLLVMLNLPSHRKFTERRLLVVRMGSLPGEDAAQPELSQAALKTELLRFIQASGLLSPTDLQDALPLTVKPSVQSCEQS